MRVTIPTWITVVRLLLIVPILLALAWDHPILATILTVIALITDFLDGQLARRWNQVSQLGTFLDHFADKLLVHVVLLYFVAIDMMPAIAFGIFLARDFLVLGFRHVAVQRGIEVPSMSLGKIKLWGQGVLLVILTLSAAYPVLLVAFEVVLWVTVVLAIVSAAQLFVRARDVFS